MFVVYVDSCVRGVLCDCVRAHTHVRACACVHARTIVCVVVWWWGFDAIMLLGFLCVCVCEEGRESIVYCGQIRKYVFESRFLKFQFVVIDE